MRAAEAIERIREIARLKDGVRETRPCHRDMESLERDHDHVCECLESLTIEDFDRDAPDDRVQDAHVYVFLVDYLGDDLYVKVSYSPNRPDILSVLSFKLDGSPR